MRVITTASVNMYGTRFNEQQCNKWNSLYYCTGDIMPTTGNTSSTNGNIQANNGHVSNKAGTCQTLARTTTWKEYNTVINWCMYG